MSREEQQRNYSTIVSRLHGVRSRQESASLTRGVLLWLAVTALSVLTVFGAEAVFHLGIGGRAALFAALALSVVGGVAWFAGPTLLARMNILPRKTYEAIALEVGKYFPDLKDRLLNAIQVYRESQAERKPGYSPDLIDASFATVATRFQTLDLNPVIDRTPVRKAGRGSLVAVSLAAAAFVAFPTAMFDAANRVFSFGTDFTPPAPFEFVVKPGDVEAIKGQDLTITATTSKKEQPELTLFVREEGQEDFDAVAAAVDSAGTLRYQVKGIRSSMEYYAGADGYRSRHYALTVVDRPFVRHMKIKLTFPSYTGIPPRYLDDNAGDITALRGTTASFDLQINKDVSKAELVFGDSGSSSLPLNVDGDNVSGNVRVLSDKSYRLRLVDVAGVANANPITYTIRTVPDMHPAIELLEPSPSVELDERMRVPVLVKIGDDFGFSKLVLHYRLAASKYEKPQEAYTSMSVPLPAQRGAEMEVPYLWNLASVNMVPEDVVEYYLEVFDNDVVSGPKSAKTSTFALRLPSMEEVFAQADKTQAKAIKDLEKTLETASEVQRSMESLQRELKQNSGQKMDWQQKKKMEDLLKRQEKMMEDVKQVQEELTELSKDMQKQDLISEETIEKYKELQDLMKEIDAPEFREMMRKMNEMMQQVTPEQMKQAMENFEFNEENFRQSIDRTIELLKRLQIEQKVDELAKRAEELAEKQENLAERTENADPKNQEELNKLAQEQRELQEQTQATQRELSQLQKQMEEFPQEMPLSEMQDAQSELNLSEMQQQMSESAGQCQGGNCKNAAQSQKKTAQQMRKFQKKMEQVKKKLNEDQQRMAQNAFRKALNNVLELSRKQEELKNETSRLPTNSQMFREKMQEQADVMEELNKVAQDLMELAKKSFDVDKKMGQHIGEAMRKMRQSLDAMQNRDTKSSGEQQGGAMTQLNEAAKQIAQGMKNSGGSGGGSMMKRLGQMAQQQQGINGQTQQQMGEGQMSQQQGAQMQRLLAQQRAVQKTLEELNQEAKRSTEGKKLLGDLDRIAEEMQEVIRDMEQSNVNPNTLQKQERILSRLLDASRSTRERDYEKKRRGETGRDIARRSPGELDQNALEPKQGLKYDLQRAINEGYKKDYENLIRSYFDALEKKLPGSSN